MGKEAARRAFGATRPLRRAGLLGYRLYLAHASIELHVNREPEVARRVLEHGLSQHQGFIAEPEYVLEYVDFLVQVTRCKLTAIGKRMTFSPSDNGFRGTMDAAVIFLLQLYNVS